MDINACLSQTLKEAIGHMPATHIVVEQTDLHTLTRLVDQHIGEKIAQRIIVDNKPVDMDMVARLAELTQQGREKGIARSEDLHLIVLERQRHILIAEEIDQRPVMLRQVEIVLLGKLEHGAFGQLIERPLAHITLLPRVASEKEI